MNKLQKKQKQNQKHPTTKFFQILMSFCLSYPKLLDSLTRDEKTDLPNVKGEVKWAIKATFAHLFTTFTRVKCLPLLAVKAGESSGDKGRFCHAFNPYL